MVSRFSSLATTATKSKRTACIPAVPDMVYSQIVCYLPNQSNIAAPPALETAHMATWEPRFYRVRFRLSCVSPGQPEKLSITCPSLCVLSDVQTMHSCLTSCCLFLRPFLRFEGFHVTCCVLSGVYCQLRPSGRRGRRPSVQLWIV